MIPVEPFELRGVPFSLQTASTRSVMSSKNAWPYTLSEIFRHSCRRPPGAKWPSFSCKLVVSSLHLQRTRNCFMVWGMALASPGSAWPDGSLAPRALMPSAKGSIHDQSVRKQFGFVRVHRAKASKKATIANQAGCCEGMYAITTTRGQ